MANEKQPFWKSPILYAVISAVFIFLFLRQCSETRQIQDNRISEREYLKDEISYYKNELGQEIAEKKALKGDNETLEILLSEQIDSTNQLTGLLSDFREVDATGNITTITEIDTIEVPYEVVVPCEFSRTWSKLDPFFTISGISTQSGITIENLSIPNTLSFAIGEKKTGFFQTEYRIEAVNSNPYVKTTGLDAYSFSQPKKRFGISVYAGYGVSENFTLAPQIGVGFTFDLIRF